MICMPTFGTIGQTREPRNLPMMGTNLPCHLNLAMMLRYMMILLHHRIPSLRVEVKLHMFGGRMRVIWIWMIRSLLVALVSHLKFLRKWPQRRMKRWNLKRPSLIYPLSLKWRKSLRNNKGTYGFRSWCILVALNPFSVLFWNALDVFLPKAGIPFKQFIITLCPSNHLH